MKSLKIPESKSIYSDSVAELLDGLCDYEVCRASYVETSNNLPEKTIARLKEKGADLNPSLWYVDFTPMERDTLLGPFKSRSEALSAEVNELEKILAQE